MAGRIRDKQLKEESKELDISSPYEDYSNMMKNFNSDSDLLQPLSPPPVPNSIHEVAKPVIKPQQCNTSNNTLHTNGTLETQFYHSFQAFFYLITFSFLFYLQKLILMSSFIIHLRFLIRKQTSKT